MPPKRIDVVATVIYCKGEVLLVYNDKWKAFTLPMTKLAMPRTGGGPLRWEHGYEAAQRNVREALGTVPVREPGLLMDVGGMRQSLRNGKVGYYHFQVFAYPTSQPKVAPGLLWLTPKEIRRGKSRKIPTGKSLSPTAPLLVNSLMEAVLDRNFPPLPANTLRKSTASVAVIRQGPDEQPVWLSQWNKNWRRYFLIGGHVEEGEEPEACMQRELKEELKLVAADDYTLTLRESPPLQPLEYSAWSTGSWRTTNYRISCFDVTLFRSGLAKVEKNAANRWLTRSEVRNERCADDKLISPTTRNLLEKLREM